MNCEELREDYGAFALGSLDNPEQREIVEHLERGCDTCTPGVRQASGLVAAMAGAVELKDPPKRLRQRVLALVRPDGRTSSWASVLVPWAVAGALAITLLSVAIPARRQAADVARLDDALSVLNDPTAQDVTFGSSEKPARGRVIVSPTRGVVFIAANMPRLQPGTTFELWTIPTGGKPVPAGTFKSDEDAKAVHVYPGSVSNLAAVAVSVEPEGGSPQPTTTPFIVTKLGT